MRKYALVFGILIFGAALAAVYVITSGHGNPAGSASKDQVKSGSEQISESELEKLSSLPYTNWSASRADVTKAGVVRHHPQLAFRGLNLFNSRNLSQAHLMDMQGNIMHTWSLPKEGANSWHTIHMLRNGDLFAIVKDHKLIRLSRDSKVKWEYRAAVHHDVAISNDQSIYVPARRPAMWETQGISIPIVKEYIAVLSDSGKLIKEISLFEALSPFVSKEQIQKIQKWAATEDIPARLANKGVPAATWWENKKPDVFHVNSIQLIERDVPGVARNGDLLLSVRQLDLVCIFRPSSGELVWSWGPGETECQHHATLLENNNILLFDNGCKRGDSRVIELNPKTKQVVWEYEGASAKDFFSHRRGAAQRLANGNTLITESDRGRVFEVTASGKIVWEYFNPDVSSAKKKRAVIYRLIRLPENYLTVPLSKTKK